MAKYKLLIRMWVGQKKLFNSEEEAYEEGYKIAPREDVEVREATPEEELEERS